MRTEDGGLRLRNEDWSQKISKQCIFVAGRLKTAVLFQKPWFDIFVPMSRKTQNTLFKEIFLRKFANEDKLQAVQPWEDIRKAWIFFFYFNVSRGEKGHICLKINSPCCHSRRESGLGALQFSYLQKCRLPWTPEVISFIVCIMIPISPLLLGGFRLLPHFPQRQLPANC